MTHRHSVKKQSNAHAQSGNDDDDSADILNAILGHVGQREDAGYDDEGMDVSVGVGVGAVVGASVNGQGSSLGVGPRVGVVDAFSLDAP